MQAKRPLIVALTAMFLGGLCVPARADTVTLDVESVNVQVPTGSTPVNSFFDVFFVVTPDSNGPINLASFQVEVTLDSSATGIVQFVSPFATTTTESAHPQLISSNFEANYGSDNGTNTASATAYVSGINQGVNVTNLAGVMEVPFQVLPGAVAGNSYAVSILPYDSNNFNSTQLTLNDANADNAPFGIVNGQINLVNDITVPLPAAVWAGAAMMLAVIGVSIGAGRSKLNVEG